MRVRFDRSIFLQTGAAGALLLFALCTPAMAQSGDVSARLNRIENEIQTLSRALFRGETPPAGASAIAPSNVGLADTENRLSQIQMDLQTLTGRVEELGYDVNRIRLLESRIEALENNRGNAVTHPAGQQQQQPAHAPAQQPLEISASSQGLTGDSVQTYSLNNNNPDAPYQGGQTGQLGVIHSNPASATGSPEAAYESAFALLRNQDYIGAQSGFDSFIKAYPNHALVSNAMYWMGETYYVRNQFPEATRIFAEAYQKYPDGSKAPDNLLKLGMSLAGQGKTQDACVALAQLKKQYPAGSAPVLTRADQEIERLKCKT